MLGLRFCARAFSSWGERRPLLIAVCGPLIIAASLVAEHGLQTHRLSSCGSGAQLLRGMWDLPRPGLEPVSPALAGRFSTTAPPGKPKTLYFYKNDFSKNNENSTYFCFLQIFLMSDNRKHLNLHICFLIQSSVVCFCEVNEENTTTQTG